MTQTLRLAVTFIPEQPTIDFMIAHCIETDYSSCVANQKLMAFLGSEANASGQLVSNLSKGESYLVVAIALGPFCVWLFLADRFRGLRYPLVYPSSQFEITNSLSSRFWTWGTWVDRLGNSHSLIAPEQWAGDPVFHGKLFEGYADSLQAYQQMIQKMELEFPLPWIAEKALAIDGTGWITDADYNAQWEADQSFAMTRHPEDQRLMHNPLYSPGSVSRASPK